MFAMFSLGPVELIIIGLCVGVPALVGIVILILSLVNKGKSSPPDATSGPVKQKRCPYCEHKMPANFKVCPACGKPIG